MSVFPPASNLLCLPLHHLSFRGCFTFSTCQPRVPPPPLTAPPRTRCLLKPSPAHGHPPAPTQCVLEEMAGREAELGVLREKAHHLWEGQAAGKGFVHRVSQLSAQYLALSNLTKVTPPPYPVSPHSLLHTTKHSIVSLEAAPSEFAITSPETLWMRRNVGRSPRVCTR